uniref:Uncharacterized protein n=1 Tax=Podarcis muralis TaxID=64176 RepID=A0A670I4I3_PODMU
MTPVKLAKIYHLPDNKCWKCKETEGTERGLLLNMWWDCPLIPPLNGMRTVEIYLQFWHFVFSSRPVLFLVDDVMLNSLKISKS